MEWDILRQAIVIFALYTVSYFSLEKMNRFSQICVLMPLIFSDEMNVLLANFLYVAYNMIQLTLALVTPLLLLPVRFFVK